MFRMRTDGEAVFLLESLKVLAKSHRLHTSIPSIPDHLPSKFGSYILDSQTVRILAMNPEDHEEMWNSHVALYRELWKAYADIAFLKMNLAGAEMGRLAPDWEGRLIAFRQTDMYQEYLAHGEAEIAQAEELRLKEHVYHLVARKPPADLMH